MEENIQQTNNKKTKNKIAIIAILIVIVVIVTMFLLIDKNPAEFDIANTVDNSETLEIKQEEQTLGEQVSVDNPISDIPQANIFEVETNPFKENKVKNPFEE